MVTLNRDRRKAKNWADLLCRASRIRTLNATAMMAPARAKENFPVRDKTKELQLPVKQKTPDKGMANQWNFRESKYMQNKRIALSKENTAAQLFKERESACFLIGFFNPLYLF